MPPALETRSLSHCTTRKVHPDSLEFSLEFSLRRVEVLSVGLAARLLDSNPAIATY